MMRRPLLAVARISPLNHAERRRRRWHVVEVEVGRPGLHVVGDRESVHRYADLVVVEVDRLINRRVGGPVSLVAVAVGHLARALHSGGKARVRRAPCLSV